MQNIFQSNTDSINIAARQQPHRLEIRTFGFWIYLMSDLVLFSVLFAAFAVVGRNYAGGPGPRQLFALPYLFVETMLLLTSSVAYGFSMAALRQEKTKIVLTGLLVSFLLGLGFVLLEVHEFYGLIMAGDGPSRSGFLSSFFTLVGTHGTHVSFGLLWMAVMIIQFVRKGFTDLVRSRLTLLSLFWHFLDIVWVGIFTFVYLLGVL
jgi:cytochrome o ubiquinol oxidase subunit 3